MSIKVLIVDDHPALRAGLRADLSVESDLLVVGEAGTGEQALRLVAELSPEIVLLDIELPDMSGIEVVRRLQQAESPARVLIFSMHRAVGVIRAAMRAGAWGYISKDAPIRDVAAGVRQVFVGQRFLGESVRSGIADDFCRTVDGTSIAGQPSITDREKDILVGLSRDLKLKDISERHKVSINTVKTHIGRLKKKTGNTTLAGLMKFAIDHGFIDHLPSHPLPE